MSADSALVIKDDLSLPRFELTYRATRAGGPGGQHVNTSSTRIELVWNVERSSALSDAQRLRLREKLAARLDADGNVRVVASEFRSQARNRGAADERLATLIRRALTVSKPRKRTRPTKSSVEARLQSKRLRSEKKLHRRVRDFE